MFNVRFGVPLNPRGDSQGEGVVTAHVQNPPFILWGSPCCLNPPSGLDGTGLHGDSAWDLVPTLFGDTSSSPLRVVHTFLSFYWASF